MGNKNSTFGKRETDLGYSSGEFYEVSNSDVVTILECSFERIESPYPYHYQMSQSLIKSNQKLNSQLINVEDVNSLLNSYTIASTNDYDRPKMVTNHFITEDSAPAIGESAKKRSSTTSCFDGSIKDSEEHLFVKFDFKAILDISHEIEVIKVVFTRDNIFELAMVGKKFPIHRTSDLATGVMVEIRLNKGIRNHSVQSSLFIPKNLTQRRVAGFVLDENNVTLAKARGVVIEDCDFLLTNTLEIHTGMERKSRSEGLHRLSQFNNSALKHDQSNIGVKETLKALSGIKKSKVEFLEASDGVKLAYRCYSKNDGIKAVFIFIASNSHFHDIVASRVSNAFPITTFIFELRGYGYSGGARGLSPSKEQIWIDLKTFISFIRMNHESVPIVLGGHYYLGGLILNYSSWKEKEPVDGYIFISPHFGLPSNIKREGSESDSVMKEAPVKGFYESPVFSFFTTGNSTMAQEEYTDDEHAVNPLIVDTLSVNVGRACICNNPRKMFENIDRTFSLWLGERELALHPENTIFILKNCLVQYNAEIVPQLNHFGLLNVIHNYIGNWIMSLCFVKLCSAITHVHSSDEDVTDRDIKEMKNIKHNVLQDVGIVQSSYYYLNLHKTKVRYLSGSNGHPIKYRFFLPESKPVANLILLQGDLKTLMAFVLSQKFDLGIYSVDVRGIDSTAEISYKEQILSDVKTFVRHIRNNSPDIPIILGGHGFGAGISIHYANWRMKEPVHGYIFVSPVLDARSSFLSDRVLMNEANLKSVYPNPNLGIIRSLLQFRDPDRYSAKPEHDKLQCITRPTANPILRDIIFARNIVDQVRNLDSPFGLWVGSTDEFINADLLINCVSKGKSTSPLSVFQVIPHSSHIGTLITSTAFIIPWIKKLIKIITPMLSFRLAASKLEDFEKLQFIGKGSFGRVYLVRHIASNQYFAMKVLSKTEIYEAKEIRHVINEKYILREMNSPFIVSYICSFQDDRHLYLVMEYVAGGELYTQLCLRRKFSTEVAKFYAAEILLFFEEIHNRNIVYRDLKPENILLDSMGHIKVTDFGFSKYTRGGRLRTFCGTPQYIAPEMIINAEVGLEEGGYGLEVDYWSFGILLYEMLVGVTPFSDSTPRSIYRRILYAPLELPWSMDPLAKDIIKRLLVKFPKSRLGYGQGQAHRIDDIKRHKWFKGIDWELMKRREVPSPFVPRILHPGDTSNFLPYQGDQKSETRIIDTHGAFKDF